MAFLGAAVEMWYACILYISQSCIHSLKMKCLSHKHPQSLAKEQQAQWYILHPSNGGSVSTKRPGILSEFYMKVRPVSHKAKAKEIDMDIT